MNIPLTPVESSQIKAIGYDGPSQTLAIQFKAKTGPGSVYHYRNVPNLVHQQLLGAESIGKYFGQYIKPFTDKYPFTKQPV